MEQLRSNTVQYDKDSCRRGRSASPPAGPEGVMEGSVWEKIVAAGEAGELRHHACKELHGAASTQNRTTPAARLTQIDSEAKGY